MTFSSSTSAAREAMVAHGDFSPLADQAPTGQPRATKAAQGRDSLLLLAWTKIRTGRSRSADANRRVRDARRHLSTSPLTRNASTVLQFETDVALLHVEVGGDGFPELLLDVDEPFALL